MKRILIASNTMVADETAEVVRLLTDAGHAPIMLHGDEVFAGTKELTFALDHRATAPVITYDGQVLSAETIGAAWYWRPNGFFAQDMPDKGRMLALGRELSQLQRGVLEAAVPSASWLNVPDAMRRANSKLHQLQVARDVGFVVPPTVVSNHWPAVKKLARPVIMKMMLGELFTANKPKMMYTTLLDNPKLESLRHASPFPGIFQTYVPKAREWRVTLIGGKVFPVAIYTHESAKVDWRQPNDVPGAVRYAAEPLPADITQKCRTFMRKMKLAYGAFDLIETPSGEFVFLEMNPNGQFRGFEQAVGHNHMSRAIADRLLYIATKRG